MIRVAAVGEAMVELSRSGDDLRSARIGFAGDTLNWAIYLMREGRGEIAVDYLTRLGSDPFSNDLEAFIVSEGIGTQAIGRSDRRTVGLYAISTDATGERSFAYWRDTSAARELFEVVPPSLDDLAGYDVLAFSAITLAILSPAVRDAFFGWLPGFRDAGGRVVFDSNYRPRLWPDAATARTVIGQAWALTDIALPSLDDELGIWGDASEDQVVARLRAAGVRDGAMKRGGLGPRSLGDAVQATVYPPAQKIVDTTSAGDAFNGGYLAARLTGRTQAEAMASGHALACRVIGYRGAILPREGAA